MGRNNRAKTMTCGVDFLKDRFKMGIRKRMYATVHQLVPYMHLAYTKERIEYQPCSSKEPDYIARPIMMRAREGDLAACAQEELSVVFCLFERRLANPTRLCCRQEKWPL